MNRQGGWTIWSILSVALLITFFALLFMKLFPPYFDNLKIQEALETVADDPRVTSLTRRQILRELDDILYIDYARETAVDAVSLDYTVPDRLARELQSICVTQGNIDPYALVAGGSSLRREVERVKALAAGGAHIVNLGHGIVPQTPPDHVAELVASVRAANG